MIARLAFVAVCAFAFSCHGAEQKVIDGTLSPDKRNVIVEEQSDDHERDYYFARASDHKKLGEVLPTDQRGQISNVAIVASWNADSSKVALLVFYGTKASELLLFTKDAFHRFEMVSWQPPDADAIYRHRTGRSIPRPGDRIAENAVGPWVNENTVRMASGQATQTEDQDRYTHLLATFEAKIYSRHAEVSALQLEGPFSDEADTGFAQRWGNRYFETISE